MSQPTRLAFYDFDGTLVSGNIVRRYAFFARNHPSSAEAIWRYARLLLNLPVYLAMELYSRRLFNAVFYREYKGLKREWMRELSGPLFDKVIRPTIYPGAKASVEGDRRQGFRPVLVSGELDFALEAVVGYFGFEGLICNSLAYKDGTATGEVVAPLIAEQEKVAAMLRLCREANADPAQSKAYSDSLSDVPMLEAVGNPVAVNPDQRLRRLATRRGWPVLDLKK